MYSKLAVFKSIGALAMLSLLLAACGSAATQAPAAQAAAPSEAPAATQAAGCNDSPCRCRNPRARWISLTGPAISNAGANDPNYDWVTGFEKDTGCMVKVKDAGDLGRDGAADEQWWVRPGDGLGRREPPLGLRRIGSGNRYQSGPVL